MSIKVVLKGMVSVLIENGKLSIGRLLLISVFALAIVKWSMGTDLPSTMVSVMMALLGYVMGSKLVGNISDTVQTIKGGITNITNVTKAPTNIINGSTKTPEIED